MHKVKLWCVVSYRRNLVCAGQMLQLRPCDYLETSCRVFMIEIQLLIVPQSLIVADFAFRHSFTLFLILFSFVKLAPFNDVGKMLFNLFDRLKSQINLQLSSKCE